MAKQKQYGQSAVNQLLLISFTSVYLFAFTSLYIQIPGLYSNEGILPIAGHLERSLPSSSESMGLRERMETFPTLIWLYEPLGITPSRCMELVAITGIVASIAAIMSFRLRTRPVFALLWLCYFSLYKVGQTFLHFQWDSLMLETGALCVLSAPTWAWLGSVGEKGTKQTIVKTDHNEGVGLMMWRWLFFRLMYLSGIVKLTSQCPTWWGLTAMDWHYESQCIPTPLAWYAKQLPQWFQALSVVGVYVIEIGLPFLFFLPFKRVRLAAGISQVALMVMIFASGNYNFFNIMTAMLVLSMLYDEDLEGWLPASFLNKHADPFATRLPRMPKRLDQCLLLLAFAVAFACMHVYFGVHFATDQGFRIASEVQFTRDQYARFVTQSMQAGMLMGAIAVATSMLLASYSAIKQRSLFRFLSTVVTITVALVLFTASLETLRWNDQQSQLQTHPYWRYPKQAAEALDPYAVVNSYGLFRRMTGVGGRPELTVEASQDGKIWHEYLFKYKPNRPEDAPLLIAPHQPRLDWQMWFAALGSIQHNVWLQSFAIRLLQGKQDVLDLIQPEQDQAIRVPPKYVRISSWTYRFTSANSTKWWEREVKDGLYLGVVALDTHAAAIKQLMSWLDGGETNADKPISKVKCTNDHLCHFLSSLRQSIRKVPDGYVILTSVLVALMAGSSSILA